VAAVSLAACGSSSAAHTTHATHAAHSESAAKPAAEVAKDGVAQMVLTTGDLGSFQLQSHGGETLRDQLPPKFERHHATVTRLVKANWLASEHSVLASPDGKVKLSTDVNLFKSSVAATAIWKLERDDGYRLQKMFHLPLGAPQGAEYDYQKNLRLRLAVFQLGWQEGATMNFERAIVPSSAKFTAVGRDSVSEDRIVVVQDAGIRAYTQAPRKRSRPLDVREQERHSWPGR
jgi:uncharacterized lipoprotein YmbA